MVRAYAAELPSQVPALRLLVLRPNTLPLHVEGEQMSILDPKFRYTPAAETNIRKTFARIKKAQREKEEAERSASLERIQKVRRINER
jgi:hypothetical protein